MIAFIAVLSLAATPVWTVRTQTNLLNQPETVAELPETPNAPGQYLKFSCSVMSGPIFEAGLGPRSFEEFARFSANEATTAENVSLTLQAASAILSVRAIPVAENVTAHAYAVGGSEAVVAARKAANAAVLSIASPVANAQFEMSGGANAIGQVLEACPFKG